MKPCFHCSMLYQDNQTPCCVGSRKGGSYIKICADASTANLFIQEPIWSHLSFIRISCMVAGSKMIMITVDTELYCTNSIGQATVLLMIDLLLARQQSQHESTQTSRAAACIQKH